MKNKRIVTTLILILFTLALVIPVIASPLEAVDDSYTKSLLHLDGSDASTTFTDESGKTWTAAGNAQLDTAQNKFGTASLLLDGTGDYIYTSDSDDFYLSGNFTIDFWLRFNSLPTANQIVNIVRQYEDSTHYYNFRIATNADATIYSLHFQSNNGGTVASSSYYTATLSTNTWTHIALVKSGNSYYIFQDGTSLGSASTDADAIGNYTANILLGGSSPYINGWIDEFRFTNGLARWTSNFTPPTAQYEPTPTPTSSPTNTNTPTNTPTNTATFTPTNTATDTPTSTATYTPTNTPLPCSLQATLTSSNWTNTAGINNDVCTDNAVRMVWREPGASTSSVDAAFSTTAETMYNLTFNGYYTGGHTVTLQCDNGSTWDTLATLTTSQSEDQTITTSLPQTCNDGSPSLRFYHAASGNASHYLYIDQFVLSALAATETPTPTETYTPTTTYTPTITFTPSPVGTSVVPTFYLNSSVSYGEYAVVGTNLALLCVILLTFIIFLALQLNARRKS